MRYRLKIVFIVLAAAVFQTAVLPGVWPFRTLPDMFLMLILILAMNLTLPEALIFAFFAGFLKDSLGARLFGFYSSVFVLEAFSIHYLCRLWYREYPWIKFIFLAAAGGLNYLLLSLILKKPYIALVALETGLNCLFLPLMEKALVFIYARKQDTTFS